MFSDSPMNQPVSKGDNLEICITPSNTQQARQLFNAL